MKEKNLYQRILAVTEEVGTFEKDGRNTFHNYKFASIEQIVATIQPVLIKHGVLLKYDVTECVQVAVRQFTEKKGWIENEVTRVTIAMMAFNVDDPTDNLTQTSYGFGIDSQDKGVYKAISGARKYGIFGMFNLMAGDDDPEYNTQPSKRKPPISTKPVPKANPELRAVLFPDLKTWPPKNEGDYAIGISGKQSDPISDAFRKKVRITFKDTGYGSDTDRRALMAKLYSAFEIPKEIRHKTSHKEFSKGHGFFFMNCLEHPMFAAKEADDPLPWNVTPADDVELDADIDLEEEEDYLHD